MKNENNKLKIINFNNNILDKPNEITNDPISKLLVNYDEIDKFLKLKDSKITKLLYFNKDTIHKILYKEEKIINIDDINNDNEINLNFNFYLLLLIMDDNNKDIINYSFSIDFIKNIHEYKIIRNKKELYKKLISSKIIIDLINYYIIKNEENNELNKIKEYNMEIIKNKISIFKDMDLEWKAEEFLSKRIDDIFIDIIEKILLTKKRFKYYDFTDSIVNQLDLKNISLTTNMIDKLINNNKEYMQKYTILEKKDLNDENKIYFYYILLKYILKNSLYIYQINFLLKTRNFLINLTNNDINEISTFLNNNNINDKIYYIIKFILDSGFYYNKFKQNVNNSNQINGINNNYFESDYFEEEKTENRKNFISGYYPISYKEYLASEFILNKHKINKVLVSSDIKFSIDKANKKYSYEIINYEGDSINYKEFKKFYILEQKFNNQIIDLFFKKYKCLIDFLKEIKKKIKNMDINDLKLSITLKIKTINENINDLDNISCQYILNNLKLNEINNKIYQDTNILSNEQYDNFDLFIKDIIYILYGDQIIKGISSHISNYSSKISTRTRTSKNGAYIKYPNYQFIGLQEIIEKKNNNNNISIKYVKELNNNYSIIIGTDGKIYKYNNSYNKIDLINLPKIYGFCELENENRILLFSKNTLIIYSLENGIGKFIKIIENEKILYNNIIQIDKETFIICSENGLLVMKILVNIASTEPSAIKISCIGGIKINDKFSAFTSNKILANGEDTIIIYNHISKIPIEIKEYSFILTRNNLSIISIPDKYNNTKNDKLLFCACKKYIKTQKNGILLLKLNIKDDDIKIYKTFYNTGNFEVYCFCNISKFNNSNKIIGKENENSYTEYTLIGGYDNHKKKGLIKLYKIIYNKDIEKIKLEYIQDISINNIKNTNSKPFNGFKDPIYCMIQSKTNGNILIISYDGKIYSFSEPLL